MEVVMAASIDCAPHAEKKFPPTWLWKLFSRPCRKRRLRAPRNLIGSVFNSPFQISLQQKNHGKKKNFCFRIQVDS
jgi:hypothetical protein